IRAAWDGDKLRIEVLLNPQTMSISTKSDWQFTPSNAILAWVWPGLGHISLGQRKRGLLVMFGVLFLFLGGVLIGGIDVVDRKEDRLWFWAQAVCGPIALAVDFTNQTFLKTRPPDGAERSDERDSRAIAQLGRKGLGRVNEMGTLFCALAGLMNLVVILDALHHPTGRVADRRQRGRTEP
ncbi:MAG: hypothetical protein O7D97_07530, partial [Planctomycetota bacterium]|nr:hypothetical protein [Planctomycetota bacterium]